MQWIEKPKNIKLSGYDGSYAEAESKVAMSDGRIITSRVKIYNVMKKAVMFMLGFNRPATGDYADVPEFDDIIKSVKLFDEKQESIDD